MQQQSPEFFTMGGINTFVPPNMLNVTGMTDGINISLPPIIINVTGMTNVPGIGHSVGLTIPPPRSETPGPSGHAYVEIPCFLPTSTTAAPMMITDQAPFLPATIDTAPITHRLNLNTTALLTEEDALLLKNLIEQHLLKDRENPLPCKKFLKIASLKKGGSHPERGYHIDETDKNIKVGVQPSLFIYLNNGLYYLYAVGQKIDEGSFKKAKELNLLPNFYAYDLNTHSFINLSLPSQKLVLIISLPKITIQQRTEEEASLLRKNSGDSFPHGPFAIASKNKMYMIDRFRGYPISKLDTFNSPHSPLEKKLMLATAIANACQKLQKNNIVHNDLKPQNILIKTENTEQSLDAMKVNIIDFGLAFKLDSISNFSFFHLGTHAYMPQMQQNQRTTYKKDIFSFIIICTEIFSHIRPILNIIVQIKKCCHPTPQILQFALQCFISRGLEVFNNIQQIFDWPLIKSFLNNLAKLSRDDANAKDPTYQKTIETLKVISDLYNKDITSQKLLEQLAISLVADYWPDGLRLSVTKNSKLELLKPFLPEKNTGLPEQVYTGEALLQLAEKLKALKEKITQQLANSYYYPSLKYENEQITRYIDMATFLPNHTPTLNDYEITSAYKNIEEYSTCLKRRLEKHEKFAIQDEQLADTLDKTNKLLADLKSSVNRENIPTEEIKVQIENLTCIAAQLDAKQIESGNFVDSPEEIEAFLAEIKISLEEIQGSIKLDNTSVCIAPSTERIPSGVPSIYSNGQAFTLFNQGTSTSSHDQTVTQIQDYILELKTSTNNIQG